MKAKTILLSIFLLTWTCVLSAQAPVEIDSVVDESPWTTQLSVTLTFDTTSQYIGRGILFENEDYIIQPALDVGLLLYESEGDVFSGFGLISGFFGSLHGGPSGEEGPSDDPFNEADGYVGLSFGFFSKLEFSAAYYKYTSPNQSFQDIDEFDFGLAFDDSEIWSSWGVEIDGFSGLQPALTIAVETHDQADGGLDEGSYFELAIEPAFELLGCECEEGNDTCSCCSLSVSFPTALGLSIDDYYEDPDLDGDDDTFGFFQTGVLFTLGLGFIPDSAGEWEIHAGVQFLFLGDNAAELNVGDDFEVLFTGGFSVSF